MNTDKILIVDDEPDLLTILGKRLSDAGYQVFTASTGKVAFMKVKEIMPDLILLDILIPELNGLDLKARLNQHISTASIPVIFLTAKNMIEDKVEGLQIGADDYITKPFNTDELLARISAVLNRRKFYEKVSMSDSLTGLYNANFFRKQLTLSFNMAKRYNQIFSLAIIDIDNFKTINDTFGHAAGDFILKKFSTIMNMVLRKTDIITRYGGDEFAVILQGADEKLAGRVMKKLHNKIKNKHFVYKSTGEKISFSVSVGIAAFQNGFKDETALFELADANMYRNKKLKRLKKND